MTHNPMTALTGATVDRIIDDPLTYKFCVNIMNEAIAVGEKFGCKPDDTPEHRQERRARWAPLRPRCCKTWKPGRPSNLGRPGRRCKRDRREGRRAGSLHRRSPWPDPRQGAGDGPLSGDREVCQANIEPKSRGGIGISAGCPLCFERPARRTQNHPPIAPAPGFIRSRSLPGLQSILLHDCRAP